MMYGFFSSECIFFFFFSCYSMCKILDDKYFSFSVLLAVTSPTALVLSSKKETGTEHNVKLCEQSEIKIMCSREMACVHEHCPLTDDSMQFALFSKKRKEKEREGSKKQRGWPLLKMSVQCTTAFALQIEGFSSFFLLILFCFCTYPFNKPCM